MSDSEAEAEPQVVSRKATKAPMAAKSSSGSGALVGGLLAAGVAIAGAVGYKLLAKKEEGSGSAPSPSTDRKKVASPVKKTVSRRATPEASGAAAAPAAAASAPAQPRQARVNRPTAAAARVLRARRDGLHSAATKQCMRHCWAWVEPRERRARRSQASAGRHARQRSTRIAEASTAPRPS